ncbi:efflux RND transporter periplasmic adaptor subunit [Vreelandella rituensis]|uniref:Efflux RND transporter periplasmic adaptor subunit n=1 Tax=Vreelandella rituensis TaxID=2282306 RepID=A0A368U196_9GAMM|nr:efflux RND transporter periplasmic adaptor subunit [Halomonas rituensis]RCV90808.1 efflux RND transporter periplasmic adaptor subunit [Halomonas rituensis]
MPPSHPSYRHHQQGRFRLGALAALLVLAAGLAGAWWLLNQPPRIERRPPPEPMPPLVDIVIAERRAEAPEFYGFGRVIAEQEVRLASRVGGQLERFAEGVFPGQVVESGQALAYIDQADLALALQDAEAQLSQAQAALALERGEQQRAQSDYQAFGRTLSAERRALVLREPQLRQAQAQLAQAQVILDQARLNLKRATLSAPWRAVVQERLIGAGSLLSQGTEVMHLVGVERFWVRASLPGEWLPWLDTESEVTLESRGWPSGAIRQGEVISILPSLEENGLQAQLLVAVDDPLALESDGPALRLGDILRANFSPTAQEALIALPAAAVRPGERVWWLDEDDRLRQSRVELAYRGEDRLLIRAGIEPGSRVVVAGLAQPREGQEVRPRQRDAEPQEPGS